MTRSPLIIVTDLDGTLLDQNTYSYQASLPAIERLRSLRIPLILCSSKTLGEILPLWQELALQSPFMTENGGAVYWPPRYFPFAVPGSTVRDGMEIIELGISVAVLRRALQEAAQECAVKISSFGTMELNEIAKLTRLTLEQAALAAEREYDEPFFVEKGNRNELFESLRAKGFKVTRGDRFFHLTGGHDKGEAVKLLLDHYRRWYGSIMSVGLGNSANDLPLFCEVDRPVLVRNSDASYDSEILKRMPRIHCTQRSGPDGWREAVEQFLF